VHRKGIGLVVFKGIRVGPPWSDLARYGQENESWRLLAIGNHLSGVTLSHNQPLQTDLRFASLHYGC